MTQTIRYVQLPDGEKVPALGQGTWNMGEDSANSNDEISALRRGIELGLTLIDTAEMYGDGGSEKLVGKAISGLRDEVFLVSKVLPSHASMKGTVSACEASLKRLKTDYLDLYLLHWPGTVPLTETIEAMETLVDQGKIRRWGVSNFDVDDLQELFMLTKPERLSTNQILYNLSRRGVEYDLLPWSESYGLPTMAYSPIEQGRLLNSPALLQLAKQHDVSPAQIALAWVLRRPDIIAIPKAATVEHVEDNFAALSVTLTDSDLTLLDRAFPAPTKKQSLEML